MNNLYVRTHSTAVWRAWRRAGILTTIIVVNGSICCYCINGRSDWETDLKPMDYECTQAANYCSLYGQASQSSRLQEHRPHTEQTTYRADQGQTTVTVLPLCTGILNRLLHDIVLQLGHSKLHYTCMYEFFLLCRNSKNYKEMWVQKQDAGSGLETEDQCGVALYLSIS